MRKATAVATLVLGTLAALSAPALAATARPGDAALGPADLVLTSAPGAERDVGSGAVRVSAQPGGGVWQSAVVTNRSRVRFTVRLSGGDDGWVRPAVETVLVDPGASVTVDFTVAPPPEAEAGDHRTRLVAEVPGAPGVRQELEIVAAVVGAPVPRPDDAAPDASPPGAAARTSSGDEGDAYAATVLVGTTVLVVLLVGVPPSVRAVRRRWRDRGRRARARPRPVKRARTRVDVQPLDLDWLNRALAARGGATEPSGRADSLPLDAGGVGPEAFEAVEGARLRQEHVHHQVAVVEEDPRRVVEPLDGAGPDPGLLA
jgi:hypothetical protein